MGSVPAGLKSSHSLDQHCSWPIQIVSHERELDLTQCFEQIVLLPVPLLLAFGIALVQVISINRRLKRGPRDGGVSWIPRSAAGERMARAKVVSRYRIVVLSKY